jgi:hypothetical protein
MLIFVNIVFIGHNHEIGELKKGIIGLGIFE